MAYWWVNQGQTFKQEYAGKFLWAPIENKNQQTMFHWSNLGKVTAGDTIFCYADGFIRTVATALNKTYISQKPTEFGNLWQGEGWCVDVNFLENIEPLALKHVNDLTAGLWPNKYSPIHIKPWAISNNKDRLDPYNGLLLSPNYNALFDKFLISFSPEGKIIKSDLVDWSDLKKLDIKKEVVLGNLKQKHYPFLEIHQELMESKKVR